MSAQRCCQSFRFASEHLARDALSRTLVSSESTLQSSSEDADGLAVRVRADLALFRARCRFHQGEHTAALDNVLAPLAAADHISGVDPRLSNRVEQWSAEQSSRGSTRPWLFRNPRVETWFGKFPMVK
jgi:hypothetical protein